MIYVSWTQADIEGLDLSTLHTEIDATGSVCREVGVDNSGTVVHKFPSGDSPLGERGYFDLAKVSVEGLKSSMSPNHFQDLWEAKR